MSIGDRVAGNEALFRELNERLEQAHSPAPADRPVAFTCECAALGCNRLLELTLPEYEAVRADPRWFLIAPGHELEGLEAVVRRAAGYLVVEKLGRAGAVAEATDPRDEGD